MCIYAVFIGMEKRKNEIGNKFGKLLVINKCKNTDNWVVCNSLDRIDNSVGYTKENSKPCCFMCNRIKSDFNLDELIEKIEKINIKWKGN